MKVTVVPASLTQLAGILLLHLNPSLQKIKPMSTGGELS